MMPTKYGGAIYIGSAENTGTATTLTLNDSTMSNNRASVLSNNGQSDGICSGYFNKINLNRTSVTGNVGDYGGAIIANDNILNADTSAILNNSATQSSGSLYLLTLTIERNSIR